MAILNDQVYNAALSGSFSGMTYGNRSPTSGVQADYATESAVAEAFAAAVDAAWASPVGISDAEEDMLQSACEQFWGSRWTRDPNMAPLAPYIAAIIAGVKSASTGLRSGNSAILATLADLAALPSAALADGTSCRVLTVRDVFVLAKVSALAADGIAVIDASGGGQWIRQDWTDPSWAAQATWYVDTGAENDESSGIDQAHALKTGAELSRRLSGALVQRQIDIYWSGDQAASDSLLLDLRRTKAGTIYFHGTPVTVFTSSAGGFTGVSNQNLAASTWGYVADTGLPDTWAAQGWINTLHRVRVTTGPTPEPSLGPTSTRTMRARRALRRARGSSTTRTFCPSRLRPFRSMLPSETGMSSRSCLASLGLRCTYRSQTTSPSIRTLSVSSSTLFRSLPAQDRTVRSGLSSPHSTMSGYSTGAPT